MRPRIHPERPSRFFRALQTRALFSEREDAVGELSRLFAVIDPLPQVKEDRSGLETGVDVLALVGMGLVLLTWDAVAWPMRVALAIGVPLFLLRYRFKEPAPIPDSLERKLALRNVARKLGQPEYLRALDEIRELAPDIIPKEIADAYPRATHVGTGEPQRWNAPQSLCFAAQPP